MKHLILIFLILISAIPALAATTLTVDIPCQPQFAGEAGCPKITGPASYIARIYQFGLAAASIIALGAIIIGAIEYTLSAGSPSRQQDATDRIKQAILGLALLFGAYLILYTINPKLVNLREPTGAPIKIENLKSKSQKPGVPEPSPAGPEISGPEI